MTQLDGYVLNLIAEANNTTYADDFRIVLIHQLEQVNYSYEVEEALYDLAQYGSSLDIRCVARKAYERYGKKADSKPIISESKKIDPIGVILALLSSVIGIILLTIFLIAEYRIRILGQGNDQVKAFVESILLFWGVCMFYYLYKALNNPKSTYLDFATALFYPYVNFTVDSGRIIYRLIENFKRKRFLAKLPKL